MYSCSCRAEWSGLNECHCGACHLTFSGVTAFDRHRRGRVCNDPSVFGLVLDSDVWRYPGTDPRWSQSLPPRQIHGQLNDPLLKLLRISRIGGHTIQPE
ncbi:hypothetical protein [Gordonia hongkongensis]|uniref:FDXHR family putative zinc-binding protein n=1 Tax=Gordonia hongkongensis TaxID=1701090 RepID=UPI003D717F5F